MGGRGRAHRCSRRRSCRSRWSSKPGSEAGTRPSDGQGCTVRDCTPSRVGCRKGAKAPVELADHRAHALLSPCADGQGNLSSLRTSRRYADRAHSHARHWARSPFLSGSDDSNPAEQLTYPSASAPTDSSTCILMLNDIDSTSKSGARRVGDGGLSPCSSLSSGLTCKREVGWW